jgi:Ca2+/H+ antiporter
LRSKALTSPALRRPSDGPLEAEALTKAAAASAEMASVNFMLNLCVALGGRRRGKREWEKDDEVELKRRSAGTRVSYGIEVRS